MIENVSACLYFFLIPPCLAGTCLSYISFILFKILVHIFFRLWWISVEWDNQHYFTGKGKNLSKLKIREIVTKKCARIQFQIDRLGGGAVDHGEQGAAGQERWTADHVAVGTQADTEVRDDILSSFFFSCPGSYSSGGRGGGWQIQIGPPLIPKNGPPPKKKTWIRPWFCPMLTLS